MIDETFHLTPLDVRRYEFGKALRGYDPERVNQFREQVAEELERLSRVNQDLDAKARGFHEQLRAFRERDKAINDALVSAQQLRGEIREQAEKEGQLILREAQADAERMLDEARAEVRRIEDQLGGARSCAPRLPRAAARADRASAGGRHRGRAIHAGACGVARRRRRLAGVDGIARQGMTAASAAPQPRLRATTRRPIRTFDAVGARRRGRSRALRRDARRRRSSSARDSARSRRRSTRSAVIEYARHSGLSAVDGRVARRAAAVRHARRKDRRRDAGALSPLRGLFAPAGDVSGARDARARREDADRVERVRRNESALVGGRSDADRRPHQPARRQSAHRPERRPARTALSRHVRAVRRVAARRSRATSRPSRGSPCAKASTSRSPGRISRRAPSIACCARSAPTSSACRPCPR